MCKSVNAVIVTYKPNIFKLNMLISSISKQVNKIFIINNDCFIDFISVEYSNVEIFNLGKNYGIAYATNYGISKSLEANGKFVLLSDQDTVFPNDYVYLMLKLFNDNTAAVAPCFLDLITKCRSPFYINSGHGFKKKYIEAGSFEVFQAIASGLVISHDYLNKIGLMNEYLFIDWVDFEWCWRARDKGFKIVGNADICILHELGDKSIDLGFCNIGLRSPIRHYYITRNAFYLSIYCNNLNIFNRFKLFLTSFKYILGYPIFFRPRFKNLKAVFIGCFHGVTKRLGVYELK